MSKCWFCETRLNPRNEALFYGHKLCMECRDHYDRVQYSKTPEELEEAGRVLTARLAEGSEGAEYVRASIQRRSQSLTLPEPAKSPPAPGTTALTKHVRCPSCGTECKAGAMFCSCGARLPDPRKESSAALVRHVRCPSCGTECKAGAMFCSCGARLPDVKAAPVPAQTVKAAAPVQHHVATCWFCAEPLTSSNEVPFYDKKICKSCHTLYDRILTAGSDELVDCGASLLQKATPEAKSFVSQTIQWRSDILSGKKAESDPAPKPPVSAPVATGAAAQRPIEANAIRCPKCHLLCPPGSAVCPHCKYVLDASMRQSSQKDRSDSTVATLLNLSIIAYVIASLILAFQLLPAVFGSYTILDWFFDDTAPIVITCIVLIVLRIMEICGCIKIRSAIEYGQRSMEDFSLLIRTITIELVLYAVVFIYLFIVSLSLSDWYYRPEFMEPITLIFIFACICGFLLILRHELKELGENSPYPVSGVIPFGFLILGALCIFLTEQTLASIVTGAAYILFAVSIFAYNDSTEIAS